VEKFSAKTLEGLEPYLAEELKELGAREVTSGKRVVFFSGDKALMYRVNYWSRLALRVLKPIKEFEASSTDELYEQVKKIEWRKYMKLHNTFLIDSVTFSETFNHSQFAGLRVKDAIADYFRDIYHQRPSIDTEAPDIVVNLHIRDNHCTLSLDSSGFPLFKRGYRRQSVEAPVNEVLAAGMIKMSGWDGNEPLVNPMCGSGTIAIEAAMMALGIAPGAYRQMRYAFQNWNDYDEALWSREINDASSNLDKEVTIVATDVASEAMSATRQNVQLAGLSRVITMQKKDFLKQKNDLDGGVLIMNPPYGERLEQEDIVAFYKQIGDRLKHHFTGFTAWVLSSHNDAMKHLGLRTKGRYHLLNGALECKYHGYELFDE